MAPDIFIITVPIISALIAVLAYAAMRVVGSKADRQFLQVEIKSSVATVDQSVQGLGEQISQQVIPPLHTILQRATANEFPLTPDGIMEAIKVAGMKKAVQTSATTVLSGFETERYSVTFFFDWKGNSSELLVRSVSMWLENPPPEFQLDLLRFNAVQKISKAALLPLKGKEVILLDQTVAAPHNCIDAKYLSSIIHRTMDAHSQLWKLTDRLKLKPEVLLGPDLIRLAKEEEEASAEAKAATAQPPAAQAS